VRILVAPQGFKGTLTGKQAAATMAKGVRRALPDARVEACPVADGGHETLDVLLEATGGRSFVATVEGPLGDPVDARWGVLGDGETAVVEMARASGLTLVAPARRDPWKASTRGTGQLIRAALDAGYRRVIVGVGGSATNDAGAGAAQALGARLLDAGGHDIPRGAAGLTRLAAIDVTAPLAAALLVAADVANPLCGPDGATMTYAPQKGARGDQLPALEAAIAHFAAVVERDVGIHIAAMPGGGAAGGLAAGLVACREARLAWGAGLVCDALGIDERIGRADAVIVGEGRIDAQTLFNKAPLEVARRARALGRPVVAIGGSVGAGAEGLRAHGVVVIESASEDGAPVPGDAKEAARRLADATERALLRALAEGTLRDLA